METVSVVDARPLDPKTKFSIFRLLGWFRLTGNDVGNEYISDAAKAATTSEKLDGKLPDEFGCPIPNELPDNDAIALK